MTLNRFLKKQIFIKTFRRGPDIYWNTQQSISIKKFITSHWDVWRAANLKRTTFTKKWTLEWTRACLHILHRREALSKRLKINLLTHLPLKKKAKCPSRKVKILKKRNHQKRKVVVHRNQKNSNHQTQTNHYTHQVNPKKILRNHLSVPNLHQVSLTVWKEEKCSMKKATRKKANWLWRSRIAASGFDLKTRIKYSSLSNRLTRRLWRNMAAADWDCGYLFR